MCHSNDEIDAAMETVFIPYPAVNTDLTTEAQDKVKVYTAESDNEEQDLSIWRFLAS